ncbi:hypothetical protein Acor_50690 [Acrocarpospora corrugata]|uniref:Uncharacterized protein n=1 Tax=Acrocarpospora corrugata TaxID=35763 RepID=A0A5M3W727_9ACTN|nr:hypothetical protein [Acrocarpospora corrugata]GES03003.1 hypothetical protein Acor_50690 [Acrocarpospora corrugata]
MDDVDIDLAAAETLPEFKQLLRRLSENLSLRELESRAKSANYKLSKSAASQATNPEDPRVPENRTVRALVRGCGESEEEADEWVRALIRVTRRGNPASQPRALRST